MKNTVKSVIKIAAVIFVCTILIIKADSASQGVKSAMSLCAFTVVPSLLPFMAVSLYALESGAMSALGKPMKKISRLLFNLPGEGTVIFLMSMVGGFPVGAKLTAKGVEKGIFTKQQGRRMMCFCICAGPAFVINAVGANMLGSVRAGVILLVSLFLSSLFCGVISRFFDKSAPETKDESVFEPDGSAAINSVRDSIESLITICGWILVFGAAGAIISDSPLPEKAREWVCIFLEVTNGCKIAGEKFPVCVTAFVLGWSGLAVHAQIMPFMKSVGLKYRFFAAVRAVGAAVSCAVSYALFRLFPCEAQAFSNAGETVPHIFSVSAPACAAMLLLFALIILDLAPREKV